MEFEQVDLTKNLAICLSFRRDAHMLSYGNDDAFNIEECTAWFNSLKESNPAGFLHVLLNNNIIGQLEFKSAIKFDQELTGYINLIYLLPEHRGKGYGAQLQQYMFALFKFDGCTAAYLRYLPANKIAGNFYIKQGWKPEGTPNERGQLMMYKLF